MSNFNSKQQGVLAAGETGVVDGQALYWDATPELVTCGVGDDYRFAGVCELITTGEATDVVNVIKNDLVNILGDGASNYAFGDILELGAAGVFSHSLNHAVVLEYTADAADEAADTIPIPLNAQGILLVRNETQAIDFVLVDPHLAQAAGQLDVDYANSIMHGNVAASEIVNTNVFYIHYIPIRQGVAIAREAGAALVDLDAYVMGV